MSDRAEALRRAEALYRAGGRSLREIAEEPGVKGILSHDGIKRASSAGGWARDTPKTPPIKVDLSACDTPAELAAAVRSAIRAILNDPERAKVSELLQAGAYLEERAAHDRASARAFDHGTPADRDDLDYFIRVNTGEAPESNMGAPPTRAERAIALLANADTYTATLTSERDAARAEAEAARREVEAMRAQAEAARRALDAAQAELAAQRSSVDGTVALVLAKMAAPE